MGSSSIHPAKLERTRCVTLSGVPESVRLLLVGSNEAVRRGLELLLSGEAGVEMGETASAPHVWNQIAGYFVPSIPLALLVLAAAWLVGAIAFFRFRRKRTPS